MNVSKTRASTDGESSTCDRIGRKEQMGSAKGSGGR